MAKKDSIRDKINKQKNLTKMKLATIEDEGEKALVDKTDIDIKYKLTNEIKFGIGDSCSDAQEENRIGQIEGMILNAYSDAQIKVYAKQNWNVTSYTIGKIMKKSKRRIAEPWRENFDEEVDWHVAVRKSIIRRNMKDGGDDKVALAALDSMARVQGVWDNKPAIEATDTEFDAGVEGMQDFSKLIEDVRGGKDEGLNKFKEEYKKNDKRSIKEEEK